MLAVELFCNGPDCNDFTKGNDEVPRCKITTLPLTEMDACPADVYMTKEEVDFYMSHEGFWWKCPECGAACFHARFTPHNGTLYTECIKCHAKIPESPDWVVRGRS